MSYTNLKLFALSSNQELAAKVADKMGIELGKSSVREFSDGVFKLILKNLSVVITFLFFNLQAPL